MQCSIPGPLNEAPLWRQLAQTCAVVLAVSTCMYLHLVDWPAVGEKTKWVVVIGPWISALPHHHCLLSASHDLRRALALMSRKRRGWVVPGECRRDAQVRQRHACMHAYMVACTHTHTGADSGRPHQGDARSGSSVASRMCYVTRARFQSVPDQRALRHSVSCRWRDSCGCGGCEWALSLFARDSTCVPSIARWIRARPPLLLSTESQDEARA